MMRPTPPAAQRRRYSTILGVGAPSFMKPRCMPGITKRLRRARPPRVSGVNRLSSRCVTFGVIRGTTVSLPSVDLVFPPPGIEMEQARQRGTHDRDAGHTRGNLDDER